MEETSFMHAQRILLGLSLAAALLAAGCTITGDDGRLRIEATDITVGTWYLNLAIESFGTNYYTFLAAGTAAHTIRLTNMASDLSWTLFTNPYLDDPDILAECDEYWYSADEIASTPVLTAGHRYYIAVDEWDYTAGTFNLQVTCP